MTTMAQDVEGYPPGQTYHDRLLMIGEDPCRLGYHQWIDGWCRCMLEQQVHEHPLNCIYCNLIHPQAPVCYPGDRRYSGWTYQPKRPRDGLRPPDTSPTRFLKPEDKQWVLCHLRLAGAS